MYSQMSDLKHSLYIYLTEVSPLKEPTTFSYLFANGLNELNEKLYFLIVLSTNTNKYSIFQ